MKDTAGIMRAAGGVVCAVIDYCVTNSVNNQQKVEDAFVKLGDEIEGLEEEAEDLDEDED